MNFKYYFIYLSFICLPACTWLEITEDGKNVALVKASDVSDCLKLGSTNAGVTYKIGILTRDEDDVNEELIIVAKNSAAKRGADSIVAKGPAIEGKMSFDIYKCGK